MLANNERFKSVSKLVNHRSYFLPLVTKAAAAKEQLSVHLYTIQTIYVSNTLEIMYAPHNCHLSTVYSWHHLVVYQVRQTRHVYVGAYKEICQKIDWPRSLKQNCRHKLRRGLVQSFLDKVQSLNIDDIIFNVIVWILCSSRRHSPAKDKYRTQ